MHVASTRTLISTVFEDRARNTSMCLAWLGIRAMEGYSGKEGAAFAETTDTLPTRTMTAWNILREETIVDVVWLMWYN